MDILNLKKNITSESVEIIIETLIGTFKTQYKGTRISLSDFYQYLNEEKTKVEENVLKVVLSFKEEEILMNLNLEKVFVNSFLTNWAIVEKKNFEREKKIKLSVIPELVKEYDKYECKKEFNKKLSIEFFIEIPLYKEFRLNVHIKNLYYIKTKIIPREKSIIYKPSNSCFAVLNNLWLSFSKKTIIEFDYCFQKGIHTNDLLFNYAISIDDVN